MSVCVSVCTFFLGFASFRFAGVSSGFPGMERGERTNERTEGGGEDEDEDEVEIEERREVGYEQGAKGRSS